MGARTTAQPVEGQQGDKGVLDGRPQPGDYEQGLSDSVRYRSGNGEHRARARFCAKPIRSWSTSRNREGKCSVAAFSQSLPVLVREPSGLRFLGAGDVSDGAFTRRERLPARTR
jgi:hypothetical protein